MKFHSQAQSTQTSVDCPQMHGLGKQHHQTPPRRDTSPAPGHLRPDLYPSASFPCFCTSCKCNHPSSPLLCPASLSPYAELQVVYSHHWTAFPACEQTIIYFTIDEHLGNFWYFCQLMTGTARNSSCLLGHMCTPFCWVYMQRKK